MAARAARRLTIDDPLRGSFDLVRSQPKSIDACIDVERGQFRLRDNGDGTTTIDGETCSTR